MATPFIKHINSDELTNKFLECSLCLEQFVSPKVLPCQHTFCLKCLQDLVTTNSYINSLPCPLCNEAAPIPNKRVENFPSNFMAASLLQYAVSAKTEKHNCSLRFEDLPSSLDDTQCNICEDCNEIVETFCNTCAMWMCHKCTKHHEKIPATSVHNMFNIVAYSKKLADQWTGYVNDLKYRMRSRLFFLKQDIETQTEEKQQITEDIKSTSEALHKMIRDDTENLLDKVDLFYIKKFQATQGRIGVIEHSLKQIEEKRHQIEAIHDSDSTRNIQKNVHSVTSFFQSNYNFENDYNGAGNRPGSSKGTRGLKRKKHDGNEEPEYKRLALNGEAYCGERDRLAFYPNGTLHLGKVTGMKTSNFNNDINEFCCILFK